MLDTEYVHFTNRVVLERKSPAALQADERQNFEDCTCRLHRAETTHNADVAGGRAKT